MELRQLRYFVHVVAAGSMGRAAAELGVVVSALSQQISRLEGELSTRLLQRSALGVRPTDAGLAFLRQAQLTLRHADDAVLAAQQARLSGHVSVGLAPSTAAVLGMPFLQAMRQRYPDVRLHLVENLSGHLATMLNARQLDLAVLFETVTLRHCSSLSLLDERLFLVGARSLVGMPTGKQVRMSRLGRLPLLLPTGAHGLRAVVEQAFARADCTPNVALEVDGLALLMDAVRAGVGATVQPGAALARLPADELNLIPLADRDAVRRNWLVSLSDDELPPAALAARVTLMDVARSLVTQGQWPGATLHET